MGRLRPGRRVVHVVRQALWRAARTVLPDSATVPVEVVWRYRRRFGTWPNLFHPRTYNEKVLCRSLFDRRPVLTTLSDKYAVREYVRARLGDEVLPKLYHVTRSPADIPFDSLPEQFVVKASHGSGWTYPVRDKRAVDRERLVALCADWLNRNFYYVEGEWSYKNIQPRILVEEFIDDGTGQVPTDYKLFVFDGRVELIAVHVGRFGDHRSNLYGRAWNQIPVALTFPNTTGPVGPPPHLAEMIACAETLGREFDFVRVDLYDTNRQVYFGELTTTPGGGGDTFDPPEFGRYLGDLWHLRPRRSDGGSRRETRPPSGTVETVSAERPRGGRRRETTGRRGTARGDAPVGR
jgi:hypothetical protein